VRAAFASTDWERISFSWATSFVFAPGNRDLYVILTKTFGDNASTAELLEGIK